MFELINKVKEINPLVLHYTNEVTINDCANITLALGASPLMSYSEEEVEEIVSVASSVVINIGTMNSSRLNLFVKAGKAANKFIGGLDVRGQGVDSFDDGEDISEVVKKVANKLGCIVVATGKVDFISDGENVIKVVNGTPKLKSVTGTGCMTGSLIGSYLGTYNCLKEDEKNIFKKVEAVAMGVITMALAGELADKNNIAIGSFKEKLMNNVYEMNKEKLKEYARIN